MFIVLIIYIILSYSRVEILTLLHGNEFEGLQKQTNMIGDSKYLKVFEYSEENAQVYYVEEGGLGGDMLTFEKNNDEWVMISWDAVWSKYGSADDITWPFYR